MNFIDYCIATKNYSALDAVNEYTKEFAKTNKQLIYADERSSAARKINHIRNRVNKFHEEHPEFSKQEAYWKFRNDPDDKWSDTAHGLLEDARRPPMRYVYGGRPVGPTEYRDGKLYLK